LHHAGDEPRPWHALVIKVTLSGHNVIDQKDIGPPVALTWHHHLLLVGFPDGTCSQEGHNIESEKHCHYDERNIACDLTDVVASEIIKGEALLFLNLEETECMEETSYPEEARSRK
jgi:hypothetical protein